MWRAPCSRQCVKENIVWRLACSFRLLVHDHHDRKCGSGKRIMVLGQEPRAYILLANGGRERNFAWHGLLKPRSAPTRLYLRTSPPSRKHTFKYRSLCWPFSFKPAHSTFLFQQMGIQRILGFATKTRPISAMFLAVPLENSFFTHVDIYVLF